ncbi:MAG: ubiquinol-cytochrome C chaperone family protein [Hyphomicrobiales bacterium]
MPLSRLFRKPAPAHRRLYAAIVAAARHPVPYADWRVPDSLDGRFDMIAIHAYLALDRLKGCDAGFRQALVDELFADMDRSLRELGVGDLSVGKQVRRMAEVLYGRIAAYERALPQGPGALEAALARNVFPDGAPAGSAAKLAAYVRDGRDMLATLPAGDLLDGRIAFPEPRP